MRRYKLFTFSSLRGVKLTENRKALVFENTAFLDVRSVRSDFCDCLLSGLNSDKHLELFGQPLSVQTITVNNTEITQNKLTVEMLSPLTVHKTGADDYTDYINPLDSDFSDVVNLNFARKYYAFYKQKPSGSVSIKVRSVSSRDKYITLYKKAKRPDEKDLYITGWRGEYELSGRPEHLNFLYYCGLGARNSDGFGMFKPI